MRRSMRTRKAILMTPFSRLRAGRAWMSRICIRLRLQISCRSGIYLSYRQTVLSFEDGFAEKTKSFRKEMGGTDACSAVSGNIRNDCRFCKNKASAFGGDFGVAEDRKVGG